MSEELTYDNFSDFNLRKELAEAIKELNYKTPTPIQKLAVPPALKGNDIYAIAETGSGKTAAFAIPMIQALLENPHLQFGIVISPTRELCVQIAESFMNLLAFTSFRVACIYGGENEHKQLLEMPNAHIIVATPGRLMEILTSSKKLKETVQRNLEFLVFDEADRLLEVGFESHMKPLEELLPRQRRTMLFSATASDEMTIFATNNLHRNYVRVKVESDQKTAKKLKENMIFVPHKFKDAYLVYYLMTLSDKLSIVFAETNDHVIKLNIMLKALGLKSHPLGGKMDQQKRLESLNKFKAANEGAILVATDVASRGLDIPNVDFVFNYDLPMDPASYVHRVGRTARAGKAGQALSCVTQFSIAQLKIIEDYLGKTIAPFDDMPERTSESIQNLHIRCEEAARIANDLLKEEKARKDGQKKKRRK